jgi:hypothetical protein
MTGGMGFSMCNQGPRWSYGATLQQSRAGNNNHGGQFNEATGILANERGRWRRHYAACRPTPIGTRRFVAGC